MLAKATPKRNKNHQQHGFDDSTRCRQKCLWLVGVWVPELPLGPSWLVSWNSWNFGVSFGSFRSSQRWGHVFGQLLGALWKNGGFHLCLGWSSEVSLRGHKTKKPTTKKKRIDDSPTGRPNGNRQISKTCECSLCCWEGSELRWISGQLNHSSDRGQTKSSI